MSFLARLNGAVGKWLDGLRLWFGRVAQSLGSNLLERMRLHCLA